MPKMRHSLSRGPKRSQGGKTMKKRIFAFTGILLALLLVLAGCGSRAANDSPCDAGYGSYNQKSESYKASETLFDIESPMMPSPEPGERDDDAALTTDRKLIQTAWMELESRDYAQALAALEQMVTDCGGYIESRSEQGGSLYSSRYNARYASITARIPADKLETAMDMAGELCNVVSRSTDVADVTESYADTEARLKTLRLQEERLLEILSKAMELSDVLELESRLSDVRYQIESYEATLRSYDSRVSYSTLHITLQEVVEYSIINSPPQTLGQRLSDGFKDSMRMVKNSAENALVWLVTYLPLVLLWAVILAVVVWLVLRLVRRAQKAGKLPKVSRKGKPQAQAPAEQTAEEKKNS